MTWHNTKEIGWHTIKEIEWHSIQEIRWHKTEEIRHHVAASEKDLKKIAQYIFKLGLKCQRASKSPTEIYYLAIQLFPCRGE